LGHTLCLTYQRVVVGTFVIAVEGAPRHCFREEIVSELQKLGYKGYAKIWFCSPGCPLNTGLRACREGNGVEITSNDEDYVLRKEDYIGSGDGLVEIEVKGESTPSSEVGMFDDSADNREHEDYFNFDVKYGNEGATSNAFGGFNGQLNGQNNKEGNGVEAGGDATKKNESAKGGEVRVL
ncbi:hypothetical protein PIB30_016349, partial [Stylosanthes scabra]|nr:hypothetical protein [Stylosanthes scabra]